MAVVAPFQAANGALFQAAFLACCSLDRIASAGTRCTLLDRIAVRQRASEAGAKLALPLAQYGACAAPALALVDVKPTQAHAIVDWVLQATGHCDDSGGGGGALQGDGYCIRLRYGASDPTCHRYGPTDTVPCHYPIYFRLTSDTDLTSCTVPCQYLIYFQLTSDTDLFLFSFDTGSVLDVSRK